MGTLSNKELIEKGKATRFKSGERVVKIARKGGLANKGNPKTIIAAKIRHMKKHGLTDKKAKELYDAMTNADLNAMDIYSFLQRIKTRCDDVKDYNVLARNLMEWHKLQHGSKDNKGVQVNIQINKLSDEEMDLAIKRLVK